MTSLLTRIFTIALFAGSIAGISFFAVQSLKLVPLILQAETYEEAAGAHTHTEGEAHTHDAEAWEPANGFERQAYTLLANIVTGIGFALLLAGAITLRGKQVTAQSGLLWGLAGFAVFSLAPSMGLPPELPTTLAAELSNRQVWWLFTAGITAFGLYLLVFNYMYAWKLFGAALIVLPQAIGAPHPQEVGGIVPTELNASFAAASLATAAVFWAVLGTVSGFLFQRKVPFAATA